MLKLISTVLVFCLSAYVHADSVLWGELDPQNPDAVEFAIIYDVPDPHVVDNTDFGGGLYAYYTDENEDWHFWQNAEQGTFGAHIYIYDEMMGSLKYLHCYGTSAENPGEYLQFVLLFEDFASDVRRLDWIAVRMLPGVQPQGPCGLTADRTFVPFE